MRWVVTLSFGMLLTVAGTTVLCAWLALMRPFVFDTTKRQVTVRADPITLRSYTHKLSTEFVPRDYRHVENLNHAAEWIFKELKRNSRDVWFQNFQVDGLGYKNVVAEYKGGVNKSSGTIIVGAHYDACGESPGADDNASGVAGLLELSRLLASAPLQVNVVLVAYTLEEPPFFGTDDMGSAVHVASLLHSLQDIRLMISLEMIGYFSDQPKSQSYPLSLLNVFYPTRGDFIALVGPMALSSASIEVKAALLRSTRLRVYSINAPSWIPGIDFSDHRNYWSAGVDALMVTDTAFFRNKAYHSAEDTYDRLDYHRMAEVVTGIYEYLLSRPTLES